MTSFSRDAEFYRDSIAEIIIRLEDYITAHEGTQLANVCVDLNKQLRDIGLSIASEALMSERALTDSDIKKMLNVLKIVIDALTVFLQVNNTLGDDENFKAAYRNVLLLINDLGNSEKAVT